ncbi:MAG: hypothetical protein JNK00_05020 [Flavipsychrobacter sp.]|nr:hypothetical protein [Flavipsychrobacter sp.]
MRNKITTTAQLQQLHEGDTVIKYPVNGETEPHYDETQTERAQLYTISAVNKDNDMVYLITTQPPGVLSEKPGNLGRLFIHKELMLKQGLWWI